MRDLVQLGQHFTALAHRNQLSVRDVKTDQTRGDQLPQDLNRL